MDLDSEWEEEEEPVDDSVDDQADIDSLLVSLLLHPLSWGEKNGLHEDEDTDFVEIEEQVAETAAEKVLKASERADLLDDVGCMHGEDEVKGPADDVKCFIFSNVLDGNIGVDSHTTSDKESSKVDLT